MPLIKKNSSFTHSRKSSGFTLLEVMVAMVIFSIGLLGLAGLQAQSVQFSHSAYLRSQATFHAYDILEKMRANRAIAFTGNYNASFASTGTDNGCYSNSGNCTPTQLALHDIFDWKQLLTSLPDGDGSVSSTLAGTATTFTIIVTWSDRSASDGSGTESITVRSEI